MCCVCVCLWVCFTLMYMRASVCVYVCFIFVRVQKKKKAPDDYVALQDLKKDEAKCEKYYVTKE